MARFKHPTHIKGVVVLYNRETGTSISTNVMEDGTFIVPDEFRDTARKYFEEVKPAEPVKPTETAEPEPEEEVTE